MTPPAMAPIISGSAPSPSRESPLNLYSICDWHYSIGLYLHSVSLFPSLPWQCPGIPLFVWPLVRSILQFERTYPVCFVSSARHHKRLVPSSRWNMCRSWSCALPSHAKSS